MPDGLKGKDQKIKKARFGGLLNIFLRTEGLTFPVLVLILVLTVEGGGFLVDCLTLPAFDFD